MEELVTAFEEEPNEPKPVISFCKATSETESVKAGEEPEPDDTSSGSETSIVDRILTDAQREVVFAVHVRRTPR